MAHAVPHAVQDFTALVDYSHKPGAIEAVLTALRETTEGRVTMVVGCGGDRDRAKRPLMGEAAARLARAWYPALADEPLAVRDARIELRRVSEAG